MITWVYVDVILVKNKAKKQDKVNIQITLSNVKNIFFWKKVRNLYIIDTEIYIQVHLSYTLLFQVVIRIYWDSVIWKILNTVKKKLIKRFNKLYVEKKVLVDLVVDIFKGFEDDYHFDLNIVCWINYRQVFKEVYIVNIDNSIKITITLNVDGKDCLQRIEKNLVIDLENMRKHIEMRKIGERKRLV